MSQSLTLGQLDAAGGGVYWPDVDRRFTGSLEDLDFTPKVKNEADALIGSDGNRIENYIAQEQNVVHQTLGETLGDTSGGGIRDFDGGEGTQGWTHVSDGDEDSDLSFVDTDDESEELSFEDSVEQSRLEGEEAGGGEAPWVEGQGSNRVIEPVSVDEPNVVGADPIIDSTAAHPALADGEAGLPSVYDTFSWSHPKTWKNVFKRSGKGGSNDLSEPLLQGTEMTDMSNLPFRERPDPFEMSPELGDPARGALNELISSAKESGLGDSAIASELGIGLSSGGGMWISRATLKQYLMKQGKGLLMAPLIAPLVLLLNQAHDGLGDMMSLGMVGADLLSTGDPLGLLVWGVGQLWDASSESRQKVIDNDTPNAEYGTRIGYVREGDTWYPAIYNQEYKSTGLWAKDQQITLVYGHDIVWKSDGSGSFVPMIPGAKHKNFVASDDEWDGTKFKDISLRGREFTEGDSGKALVDTTRDWYFLSDDDYKKVVSGTMHLQKYDDDPKEMNGAARQVNDWRKSLDYAADWKWSSAVRTMGPGAALNNYAGSRGLQRLMYEGVQSGNMGIQATEQTDYNQYLKDMAAGTGADFDSGHGTDSTFGKYLIETVLKDHIKTLYQTQKIAAAEAGFDKLYQSKVGGALEAHDPDRLRNIEGATVWSAMYLDTAKDVPVASSAEELNEQLHNIELLNDRTPAQRNYLAQKVQTRYWMQQVVGIGRSTELLHMLNGRDYTNGDPYGMKKYTTTATAEFEDYIANFRRGDDPRNAIQYYDRGDGAVNQKVADQHLDAVAGFAMPWQNAGESWLPSLTGAYSGSSAKDYMDDYRAAAYDRLSEEAIANTTEWINATGKLDPNLHLEGVDYLLQSGGLYHDGANGEQSLPYDYFQRDYVKPGTNSKYTKLDMETGDYVLTEEGKEERRLQDGLDDLHEWEKQQADLKKQVDFSHTLGDPDDKDDDGPDTKPGDLDLDANDAQQGAESWGSGDYTEFGQQFQDYDVPAGWHWEPATGADASTFTGGIYVAPDGARFADAGRGPMSISKASFGMYYEDYFSILDEAQKRLGIEQQEAADAAAKAAQEDADLKAYGRQFDRKGAYGADAKEASGREFQDAQRRRQVRWAADDALEQAFEESQQGIRTKSDILRQAALFAAEDAAAAAAAADVRSTAAQSHGTDAPPSQPVATPVVGDHPEPQVSAAAVDWMHEWAHGKVV